MSGDLGSILTVLGLLGIVLLAMTFILLPVLPNRRVEQLLGLNPYEIWLMTIMIAAISFAGYIAVRIVGHERGLLMGAVGRAVRECLLEGSRQKLNVVDVRWNRRLND